MSSPARPLLSRTTVVLAASLVLGALAGWTFYAYATVWMRPVPHTPLCAQASRSYLKRRELASGTEPHKTSKGETVYLTTQEDRAVRCARGLSEPLALALAGAFGQVDDRERTRALVAAMRDLPADAASDPAARAAYIIATAAVKQLEDGPDTQAARAELDNLYVCRFDAGLTCPTRPPLPWTIFAAGVPAVAGLGLCAVRGVGAWRRRRKKS